MKHCLTLLLNKSCMFVCTEPTDRQLIICLWDEVLKGIVKDRTVIVFKSYFFLNVQFFAKKHIRKLSEGMFSSCRQLLKENFAIRSNCSLVNINLSYVVPSLAHRHGDNNYYGWLGCDVDHDCFPFFQNWHYLLCTSQFQITTHWRFFCSVGNLNENKALPVRHFT